MTDGSVGAAIEVSIVVPVAEGGPVRLEITGLTAEPLLISIDQAQELLAGMLSFSGLRTDWCKRVVRNAYVSVLGEVGEALLPLHQRTKE